MIDWRAKPTKLQIWPADIDYVMFVDESGTAELAVSRGR